MLCDKLVGMAASSSTDASSLQISKMEAAWRKTASAKKAPRVKICTDLEEKVKRCLRDHFAGWTRELIHGVVVEDMTLYDRLMRDKGRWMENKASCPMGGPYWEDLREKYGGSETLVNESQLHPESGVEACAELRAAALEAMSRPARRSRVLQWLSCAQSCNRTEMVAICRWVCRLKPTVSEQLQCCIEVMRCVSRLGLGEAFPKEHALMHPKWEEVLLQASDP